MSTSAINEDKRKCVENKRKFRGIKVSYTYVQKIKNCLHGHTHTQVHTHAHIKICTHE